jgi:outer membrane protein assembly factor BamB
MNKNGTRWWPAFLIAALAAAVLAIIWSMPEVPRQERILRTGATLVAAGFLSFVWVLLFSRIPWRKRFLLAGSMVFGVMAIAGIFRIRGVDGDLVPILEPRWKAKPTFASPSQSESERQILSTNSIAIDAVKINSTNSESDFPQFYGPHRNATLEYPILKTNWVTDPPRILWQHSVGAGWGGFAVKDGLAITQEQRGNDEVVACYDALRGKNIWLHSDAARYATTIAGEGPRATPTIVGERLYTFGGTGILNCLELGTGKLLWRADTAIENEAKVPDWGFTSSPLAIDGKVIVSVGGKDGSLVAYEAETGKRAWAEGTGGPDYSSPMAVEISGSLQILNFNGHGVSGHALDGAVLWNHKWPGGHPHVTAPISISSNQLLISSGYGTGSELIRVERDSEKKWGVTREWKSMSLKSKFAPIFVKDDYIYGLDDGIFTCLELKSGERKWKDGRYGHGQGLLVSGIILLTSEKGEVILIQPDPEKLVELARLQVFTDKTWNPPALAGEYLLMRNDKEAACVQLATLRPATRNVALSFAK